MPDEGRESPFIQQDGGELPSERELLDGLFEGITLTPEENERIKNLVHGEEFQRIKGFKRRYLVVGAGGDSGAAERRQLVYDLLDDRTDPSAVATQLEDFGLNSEEIRLWVRVFDILCGICTHIPAVIEDFDGGYVWELGLLFAPEYREEVWVLKRRYENKQTERKQYENGMAASYVKLLLTGDRAQEWTDTAELEAAVREIP